MFEENLFIFWRKSSSAGPGRTKRVCGGIKNKGTLAAGKGVLFGDSQRSALKTDVGYRTAPHPTLSPV